MQSLSNLEELILPPGDLGVTFKMGVNGMCTVVDKSMDDSPLQILDVIISLNGIKLVDVKDGEPAWVKLFDAFKTAPMNLVVCRTNRCGLPSLLVTLFGAGQLISSNNFYGL